MLDDLCQPSCGKRWIQGEKRPAGLVYRDHRCQEVDVPFGKQNERIRFGLRNNLNSTCLIEPGDLVAYIQFFDLSTARRRPYALSDRDMKVYEARRRIAADDGVWALHDSESDAPV